MRPRALDRCRRGAALAALLGLGLGTALGEPQPAVSSAPLARLAVPKTGAYTGAYIDFGETEDEVSLEKIARFSEQVGKPQAIVAFSNYWGLGHFPAEQAQIVANAGAVPLILWNPWGTQQDKGKNRFDLVSIERGDWDGYIDQWARDAIAYGKPLLVSWAPEMNGTWFPWSGIFYGGGEPVPGSDPPRYLGPEQYKRAYRHVVDRVRAAGALNVSWVFHTNYSTYPDQPWNRMASYYPGRDYADWIGMSAYGKQFPTERWITVDQAIVKCYEELAAVDPTKPVMLAEWGVGEFPKQSDSPSDTGGDKADWIAQAFEAMETRLPRLKAAVFWDERWRNGDLSFSNLRAASSMSSLSAYRQGVASPFWLSVPELVSPNTQADAPPGR